MAAILEPHRLPTTAVAPGPELRLLPGEQPARRRPPARSRTGPPALSSVVIVSLLAVSLMAMAMAGAVAIGRGGLADLAPASPTSGAPAPSSGAAPAGVAAGAEVVVVEPGDTLWSIARRVEPTGDVRPVVDRLVAANGSTVIVPGQELVVPR